MTRSSAGSARAWPVILLALLALIAIAPLIAHGCSCGHDFEFHLQSWLDAAAQLRHDAFDPARTISAAWNAGEPRFLFYPPLSWMLGGLLTLLLPFPAVPVAFTAIVLFGAAISMYNLALAYASPAPSQSSPPPSTSRAPTCSSPQLRAHRIRRIARHHMAALAAALGPARAASHPRPRALACSPLAQ